MQNSLIRYLGEFSSGASTTTPSIAKLQPTACSSRDPVLSKSLSLFGRKADTYSPQIPNKSLKFLSAKSNKAKEELSTDGCFEYFSINLSSIH